MITAWFVSASILTVAIACCGLVAARRRLLEALVALELAGTLTTVALVALVVGYQRSVYGDVPLVSSVLIWIGSLVYVRFVDAKRL